MYQPVSGNRPQRRSFASLYIECAKVRIKPGDLVVLCCRVSGRSQHQKRNLDDQETNLRARMKVLGASVVGVQKHVGSGWDPSWLLPAKAKAIAHGASILVAETTCRLARHPGYHSNYNPDAQARDSDLYDLALWTDGMILCTHLDPDASPMRVRSYQRKRGQWAKGQKGGRPTKPGCKKRLRERLWFQVKERKASGNSVRQIAKEFGLQPSTVQDWLARDRR